MSKKKVNILLVEDEKSHADLICRSFESITERMSVTVTYNLNEAHTSISKSTPDLIITDYILPDGKGIELIPADKEESPYPVIILTSHGDEKVAVEAMKAGAFDYIVKSEVTLDDMPRICERIMREWRLTTEHKKAYESVASFAHILEESLNEIYIFDAKTLKFIHVNKGARLNLGYSMEELNSLTPLDLKPEFTAESFAKMVESLRAGKKQLIQFTTVHRRKDGSLYDVEVHLQLSTFQSAPAFVAIILDITERKRSENALKESEEKYRKLVETAQDAIVCDINGIIVDWNKSAERLFGYSKDEITGKPINVLIPERYKNDHQNGFERFLKTGEARIIGKTVEVSGLTKEGVEIPIEISLAHQKLEKESHHFMAIIRDIAERKKIENELVESELRLREMAENISSVFWMEDTDGNLLYTSPAYEQIWGYTCQSFYENPKSWLDAIHPDDRQRVADSFAKWKFKGEYTEEFRIIRPDGEIRWIYDRGYPIRNEKGEVYRIAGIAEDITERKKTEVVLEESERRFRVIFEQAAVGVALIETKTGQFLRVNKKYCDILGLIPEEVTSTTFMAVTYPGDLQTDLDHMENLIKGEIQEFSIEKRYCRKDGEIIWVNLTVSPMWKAGETPDYHIAIVDDITEKKKMQGVLLQTEKLKALGVITSGVAHDFNNILAVISGNTQLLQESLSADNKSADRLSTILKAASDGAEIVRRMRKFMAVEKDVSEFISVNIKDVIKHSVDFTMPRWKNMAIARGINYDIDMKGVKDVPAIAGNPTELREVLINIINNALDVMPEGGTILIRTWSNDKNVYVSISDTGTGITKEVKEKIFDPFFTTKRAKGSGLGMSVSYGIIKSHGGNIEIESKDGACSTFTLTFPRDRETRQSKVSPEQTHEAKLKKLRILVIDDEEGICSMLKEFFTRNGHKAKSFSSCAEAIKILNSEEFDLVLCDLVMPDLTGHDVIEIVDKLDKKPKIGLITGWDEKIESKEREELNVDFIIKKPFVLSELTKQINELFN